MSSRPTAAVSWLALVFPLVLLCPAALADATDSISCNGSFVHLGASKVDLRGKCGDPTHAESHVEERQTVSGDATQQTTSTKTVTVTVDRWTYDFGSGNFVRYVTLENGKIVSITEGGYGQAAASVPAPSTVKVSTCDPLLDFAVGDSSDQVLARCGEPASREYKQVNRVDTVQDAAGHISGAGTTVAIEIWSYNFGASDFIRQLHFREGVLIKIATGGYGFDRPTHPQ